MFNNYDECCFVRQFLAKLIVVSLIVCNVTLVQAQQSESKEIDEETSIRRKDPNVLVPEARLKKLRAKLIDFDENPTALEPKQLGVLPSDKIHEIAPEPYLNTLPKLPAETASKLKKTKSMIELWLEDESFRRMTVTVGVTMTTIFFAVFGRKRTRV